jgi:hypothetical protein
MGRIRWVLLGIALGVSGQLLTPVASAQLGRVNRGVDAHGNLVDVVGNPTGRFVRKRVDDGLYHDYFFLRDTQSGGCWLLITGEAGSIAVAPPAACG